VAKTNIADALAKRTGKTMTAGDPVDEAYDAMFGLEPSPVDNNIPGETVESIAGIIMLDIAQLVFYDGDPFKLYPQDKLRDLARSIAEIGLQQPIRVRPKDGKYEILAGRHRTLAAKMNGNTAVAAIVEDVDDETAALIVTDTNLKQREKLLPSEKAFAYKTQLDAMKRQGKRIDLEYGGTDETSTQIAWKSESAHMVAGINNVSKDEIRRHIRLTHLLPDFLEMIDEDELPFMVGVDISYLDIETQKAVWDFFYSGTCKYKLDLKTSGFLRDIYKIGNYPLTPENILSLLKAREHKTEPKSFTINRKLFKQYAAYIPDDVALEKLFMEFLEVKFGQNA